MGLAVDRRHAPLVIAGTGGGAGRQDLVQARQLVRAQSYVERFDILVEIGPPLGARDRNDIVALRQYPGQSELRGADALRLGHRLDLVDEGDVPVEILAGEARVEAAEIVFRKVARALDLPGEEAASERAVGDIGDAELAN